MALSIVAICHEVHGTTQVTTHNVFDATRTVRKYGTRRATHGGSGGAARISWSDPDTEREQAHAQLRLTHQLTR